MILYMLLFLLVSDILVAFNCLRDLRLKFHQIKESDLRPARKKTHHNLKHVSQNGRSGIQ
jgi:hypothetical protein